MIWKALSDPTRRSILNVLKKAPHTTGELSDKFGHLSRFAIMKHLGVLKEAKLITIRREGKFRWNHINTQPIQQAYDQWVAKLVQLRSLAQTPDSMSETENPIQTITVAAGASIEAPRQRVWQALTKEIDDWWPREWYANSQSKKISLDARLGGLLFEQAKRGEGWVWATIIALEAPNNLQFKGHLTPAFGGPALSFIDIKLDQWGNTTKVALDDTIMGDISSSLEDARTDIWRGILNEGLKNWVESQI